MATDSSGWLGRVFGGAILGALLGAMLGAVAGGLALLVLPKEYFPASNEGMTEVFFALVAVGTYTVVCVIAGVIDAFSSNRRESRQVGWWTTVGLVSGLGIMVVLPRVLHALTPATDGTPSLDHSLLTIAISSACILAGLVIGKIRGGAGAATPQRPQ